LDGIPDFPSSTMGGPGFQLALARAGVRAPARVSMKTDF
jgi:hypothetical protein